MGARQMIGACFAQLGHWVGHCQGPQSVLLGVMWLAALGLYTQLRQTSPVFNGGTQGIKAI